MYSGIGLLFVIISEGTRITVSQDRATKNLLLQSFCTYGIIG